MAAPTLVQTASAAGGGIAFPSANTAGNCIVVWYSYNGGIAPTLSDSKGNSYSAFAQQGPGGIGYNAGFFIATGIAAGANTVSISTLGAGGVYFIFEYAGVTGIEASTAVAAAPSATLSSLPVGPITTTAANTLILMGGGNNSSAAAMTNSGSWPTIGDLSSGLARGTVFSNAAGAASNYSNTLLATISSAAVLASLVGLKGSGAAPGGALLINPGMDGGMHPQFKGGFNG